MNDLEIASYLDRGLSDQDRSRVEDHLAECFECRENVAGAQQLMTNLRRPRRVAALAGLVAVAAAALFVVSPALIRARQPLDLVTRDANTSSTLAAHASPATAGNQSTIRFSWAAAPDVGSYRFVLSTADGTTVWSYSGADTSVTLPENVTLDRDSTYAWFVDATLNDGTTRSTGLQQLRVPSFTR